MELFLIIVGGLVLLVVLLSALAPTRLAYTEEITVAAPVSDLYDDIRPQERLMRWSAWPRETKSTCAVDTGAAVEGSDGTVGARTVFFSKGKRIAASATLSRYATPPQPSPWKMTLKPSPLTPRACGCGACRLVHP